MRNAPRGWARSSSCTLSGNHSPLPRYPPSPWPAAHPCCPPACRRTPSLAAERERDLADHELAYREPAIDPRVDDLDPNEENDLGATRFLRRSRIGSTVRPRRSTCAVEGWPFGTPPCPPPTPPPPHTMVSITLLVRATDAHPLCEASAQVSASERAADPAPRRGRRRAAPPPTLPPRTDGRRASTP